MSETVTVTLSRPIEHDGKSITSLTFRESNVGDACAADLVEGEFNKLVAITSSMSGISMPAMKKVSTRDFQKVMSEVSGLMGEPPAVEAGSM